MKSRVRFAITLAGAVLCVLPNLATAQSGPGDSQGGQAAAIEGTQSEDKAQVRHSVEAFYKSFNSHSFDRVSEFTTDDWNHINPFGGWTRGRDAVLAELRRVHSSFLKDVSETIESLSVRFASDDVAVAIVTSSVSTYYMPDGTKHENERQRRCFIVVRRSGRWLIMQDQNTMIR